MAAQERRRELVDVPGDPPVPVVEALGALEIGAEVPEEMWQAVAETLAWAYRLDLEAG